MSLLSNLVYSSVLMHNPIVLTRPYRHLTTKVSIEPHHIMYISLDINISIMRFKESLRACRVNSIRYPCEPSKTNSCPSTKVSWLFDKLSDNNASNDVSVSVAVNKQI